MTRIKLGLNGASGKMGLAIQELIKNNDNFELVAKICRDDADEQIIKDFSRCDIIMDFSSPSGLTNLIKNADKINAKLLIGTTGLSDQHFSQLNEIANNKIVLYAPNTSLGPNLVAHLAATSAKILKNYDIEIIEMHHRHKIDAPSGTALMIGQEIAAAKNINFKDNVVLNRESGLRKDNQIGFSSVRAGGIYGEHEVIFANDHEVISIGARALSRKSFAQGALYAATWLYKKDEPGFYSMKNIMNDMI